VANIEPAKGRSVPVLIWDIAPADEVALDLYEGFPHLFDKQQVRLRLDGKLVNCMMYVMRGDRPIGKPSAFYYSAVLEGYKAAGFDVDILRTAVSESADRLNGKHNRFWLKSKCDTNRRTDESRRFCS
jgi:hypothetical protein